MRIRFLLTAVVGLLATLLLVATVSSVVSALGERRAAEHFLEVNEAAVQLLAAAGEWAVERGTTNGLLKTPEPVPSERRQAVLERRQRGDAALRSGLGRLRLLPEMRGAEPLIAETERNFRKIEELRARVDETLSKPLAERAAEVTDALVPSLTRLIESVGELRLALETVSRSPQSEIEHLVGLRHLTSQMAEYAGRERAALTGLVSSRQKMSTAQVRAVSGFRGHVELAWDTVKALRQRTDLPADLAAAMATVESGYFGTYGQLREAVLAAGATGEYALTGDEFLKRATEGIDTILVLARAMGHAAESAAERTRSESTLLLALHSALLAAGIALALVTFWVVLIRVVRPLTGMTAAMRRLAGGDTSVAVVGVGRRDEIGEMAKAVEVFKNNAVEMTRLQVEQEELKRQAERDRRRAAHELADSFEATVKEVVGSVSSSSTEMEATAQSMSSTADRTKHQALAVAAACEEASANVETVAAAAEELTASVAEIGRQVEQASRIAQSATEQGARTDATVHGLATAAQRIGEVVALIDDIASQTNLLALNATIEAARAGEAGKGFAVVASEVKALASQTARATEDIRSQIAAIQGATDTAVTAIREICGTIVEINSISAAITSAVEEQGAATQEIARNIQEAARGTEQVSANIGGVTTSTADTGAAASQVLSSANELAQQSARLTAEVDRFLATVRAA
jgi:methyl-accepting chemotaxis protein